jgi:hypothetical protein
MISFLPSHLDAATSHFGRRHLAFTCRPPTVISRIVRTPMRTTTRLPRPPHRPAVTTSPPLDAVVLRPPHSTPPLTSPPRGHSSRAPLGPLSHSLVHQCRVGPCAGCRRATKSHPGPLSSPTAYHPVPRRRSPTARRTPDAHRLPLSTASACPTAHRRK